MDFIAYNASLDAINDAFLMHTIVLAVFARIVDGRGFSEETGSTNIDDEEILEYRDLTVKLFGHKIGICTTSRSTNGSTADFKRGAQAMRDMFELQVMPKLGNADEISEYVFFFVQLEERALHFYVATKTHLHAVQMEELLYFELPYNLQDFKDLDKMLGFLRGLVGVHRIASLYQRTLSNTFSALQNKPELSSVDTTRQAPICNTVENSSSVLQSNRTTE